MLILVALLFLTVTLTSIISFIWRNTGKLTELKIMKILKNEVLIMVALLFFTVTLTSIIGFIWRNTGKMTKEKMKKILLLMRFCVLFLLKMKFKHAYLKCSRTNFLKSGYFKNLAPEATNSWLEFYAQSYFCEVYVDLIFFNSRYSSNETINW